jgi:hypothetical protein
LYSPSIPGTLPILAIHQWWGLQSIIAYLGGGNLLPGKNTIGEVIIVANERKTKKERKMEKKKELQIAQELDQELAEKRAKRKKIVYTIWKIWWIGLIILFTIVFVQTLIIRFGS